MIEFKPWPKIIRIENKRKPIFTEKIDGTNACVASLTLPYDVDLDECGFNFNLPEELKDV